jgi:hypothetical protein
MEQRILKGETRPSKVNYFEPDVPAPASLTPPADLRGAGLRMWETYADPMTESGILKSTDLELFHQHCLTAQTIEIWEREKRRRGIDLDRKLTVERLLNVLKARSIREAAELGMTPVARNRVVAKPKPKGGKLALFTGGKTNSDEQA